MTFSYELGRPSLHFVKNHPANGIAPVVAVARMITIETFSAETSIYQGAIVATMDRRMDVRGAVGKTIAQGDERFDGIGKSAGFERGKAIPSRIFSGQLKQEDQARR